MTAVFSSKQNSQSEVVLQLAGEPELDEEEKGPC